MRLFCKLFFSWDVRLRFTSTYLDTKQGTLGSGEYDATRMNNMLHYFFCVDGK
jgi:hypothetical protein